MAAVACSALGYAAWKHWGPFGLVPEGAIKLVLLNFGLSTMAGILAVLLLSFSKMGKGNVVSVALQTGLQSGLLAALIWIGAICATLAVASGTANSQSADLHARAHMWHTFFVFLAAIFTSLPAGALGGFLGLGFRSLDLARRLVSVLLTPNSAASRDRQPADGSIWLTKTLVAVGVLGFASPTLLLLRSPKVDPPPPPQVLPPAPPPFEYVKPRSFDYAEPGQFTIAARKHIPTAAPDRPMLFSPDASLFVYCPASSTHATVLVLNLDTLEEVAAFPLPRIPDQLAWSPDLHRLIYVVHDNDGEMGVLDLQTRRSTALPQPKNRDLPSGPISWWLSNQVAIYPNDEPLLNLDLDTLLLLPLEEAAPFKSADDITKARVKKSPHPEFPNRPGWRMTLSGCINSIRPPARREPSQPWNIGGYATITFKDVRSQTSQWMSQIAVDQGQIILPSPDGTKLIHHTGGQTEVCYFGTREKTPNFVSVKMPISRDKKKDDDHLSRLVKDHQLCAFVYEALNNPLNSKVIGPNRSRLHAVLRMIKWEGDMADFWVAEQFSDVQQGDIIADVHNWDGGRLSIASEYVEPTWWEALSKPPQTVEDGIPSSVSAEDLDDGISVNFAQQPYVFQLQNITHNTHPAKYQTRALGPVTQPEVSPPVPIQKPEPPPAPVKPEIPTDEIEKFVLEHHQKASEGRVIALASDYDDLVDFLGKYVTRDQIRRDEFDYHTKWNRVAETPRKPIQITREAPLFIVSYEVDFRTESGAENKWVSGVNHITLTLKEASKGFVIVKQTAEIHNRQDGLIRAAAAPAPKPAAPPPPPALPAKKPPPAMVLVPKPFWVTQIMVNMVGAPWPIEITIADHFENGAFIEHRIYRHVTNDGRVLATCTKEYQGSTVQQGDTLISTIQQERWLSGGDKELMKFAKPNSDGNVGKYHQLQITGNGLVDAEFGGLIQIQ